MGLESNFQSKALEYLNSIPGCKAENVSGNSHQSGRPDITGCYEGRMFKIELKSPDNKYEASQKQRLELRKWGSAGCSTGIIYSMATLKEFMNTLKRVPGLVSNGAIHVTNPELNGCVSEYTVVGY